MPTLHDLEAATRDLPLIGYLFSADWNAVAVDRRALLARLEAAGLATYLPPAPSHQVSLGRAIRAWIRERAAAGQRPGFGRADGAVREDRPGSRRGARDLVRVARDGASDWILFAVVAEAVDLDALGLAYSTDLRVLVRKATGAMVVTTEALGVIDDQALAPPTARRIAGELRPHWERYRGLHTAGDLGEMTRAILHDLHAVNIQPGSGWHFVPLAREAPLRRLRECVEGLPCEGGGRPWTLMLGQLDAAPTRRQLAQAAFRDFLAEVEAARGDLADFAAKPAGTVRAATVAARLTAYRRLKERVALYADLLGMQQERLQRGLDELAEQARTIVVHVAAGGDADPAAATLPLPGLVAAG